MNGSMTNGMMPLWIVSSKRRKNCSPTCISISKTLVGENAARLLKRYEDRYAVYNDDIEGTGGRDPGRYPGGPEKLRTEDH